MRGHEIRNQLQTLRTRRRLCTPSRPPIDPAGRVVILVDDGIARALRCWRHSGQIRARSARRIVVAVAVAPPASLADVRAEADEVVCLRSPHVFYSVGQFFDDFSNVSDDTVIAALSRSQPVPALVS